MPSAEKGVLMVRASLKLRCTLTGKEGEGEGGRREGSAGVRNQQCGQNTWQRGGPWAAVCMLLNQAAMVGCRLDTGRGKQQPAARVSCNL
jgi:hypothetical protein